MIKKIINSKALMLAINLAFGVTLFIGCFANAPQNMDESFKGKYWYYVNRGYPEAWAGLKLANSQVDYPLVTMPFISIDDDRGTRLEKVINLNLVWPVFLKAMILAYIPAYIFAKAVEENNKLLPLFNRANAIVLAITLLIYFILFPLI